jgi:hypothetical protein
MAPSYLVIQQGGTSCEWYASFYDDQDQAVGAIKEHMAACYDAVGPFKLEQPYTVEQQLELLDLFATIAGHAIDLHAAGDYKVCYPHQQKFGI